MSIAARELRLAHVLFTSADPLGALSLWLLGFGQLIVIHALHEQHR